MHRDLKPSNVLLEPRLAGKTANELANSPLPFTPRITDFGLAKINDMSGDETRTGSMLGTPAYMAPEQAEGRTDEIDNRTDVYGLGAILYEILVGRTPFVGKSEADTVRRVLTDDASFPRRASSNCIPGPGSDLSEVSGEEARIALWIVWLRWPIDLRRYMAGEPTDARPARLVERFAKWSRRRPALAALVAVSILAAVTIVGGSAEYSRRLFVALDASEQSRLAETAAREEAVRQRRAGGRKP